MTRAEERDKIDKISKKGLKGRVNFFRSNKGDTEDCNTSHVIRKRREK